MEQQNIQALFDSAENQLQGRDAIDRALNPDPADPGHVVALNLVPRTPVWLQSINAMPMYLGLDLRGGVHFLMQVDMPGALDQRAVSDSPVRRISLVAGAAASVAVCSWP